ncbi:hypothetical protein H7B90_15815 [Cohnella xylanilytica]|uniref:Uncharacterized protein n=2 Tax=Cohnella xylanilytica TaxID=557555 RepID=A0A841TWG5_9BACL|nr:hypothetical protein [Cohnella xylanilytica]MBB6692877.1 hypothetical protein [Cohnella xylanilytica]
MNEERGPVGIGNGASFDEFRRMKRPFRVRFYIYSFCSYIILTPEREGWQFNIFMKPISDYFLSAFGMMKERIPCSRKFDKQAPPFWRARF